MFQGALSAEFELSWINPSSAHSYDFFELSLDTPSFSFFFFLYCGGLRALAALSTPEMLNEKKVLRMA
jgi:hypothetical protein